MEGGKNRMINYIVKAGDIQTIAHDIWILSRLLGKGAKLSDVTKLDQKQPERGDEN
jgi:hypothetical protein